MFIEERQKDIVKKVNETGRILVSEIQELYQISADCARRDLSPDGHRGHVVNDCYPEKNRNLNELRTTSISYENYIDAIEKRGFDAFCVGGRRIKVDTTNFSKIDMEKIFLQIVSWKEEVLHD